MKQASIVTSIILGVAVLVAAYAIGRLIRQARMDVPETTTEQAVEPNALGTRDQINASRRINRKSKEPTPEERAKAKQQRLEELEARSDLTEEQKAERREKMRQALSSAKPKEPGQIPRLSPEELADLRKRLQGMSAEERAAFLASIKGKAVARPNVPVGTTAETQAGTEPSADGAASESPASEPNQN